jgi:hypothetical protein
MNKKDKECLSHFHDQFEHQWKLNQSARDNYDDDFEHYVGYRNPDSYPLVYSLFFPQLLPRILTMLSRMLEQLYQGGLIISLAYGPENGPMLKERPV